MSITSKRICCTQCEYETHEVFRPIVVTYVFPDGTEVASGRAKGWCYDCDGYKDIESADLASLQGKTDAADQKIGGRRARLGALSRGWLGRFRNTSARWMLGREIKELQEGQRELSGLFRVARQRTSRARCLTCWSENTSRVSFNDSGISEGFVHRCGGQLRIVADAKAPRFHFGTTRFVLDIEGRLLEERDA